MSLHTKSSPTVTASVETVNPKGRSGERSRNADGSIRSPWSSVLARVVLIAMSLLFLVPIYWMVISALKGNSELGAFPPTWFPQWLDWSNFADAVNAMPFFTFFRNTVIITVCVTLFSMVSNLVIAYGFACLEWRGRDRLFYVVLATLFIPFPVTLIPMFDLYARLGWINTFLPLIVPSLFGSAFYVFLLRQFLLQIPKDLLNAARMDGASEWGILWRIVFPQARAALVTVGIFAAVGAWNDFLGPLIYLQDENVQTLSIGLQIFRLNNSQDFQFNQLMAASVLIILPLVVLFFVFQRTFIKGVQIGSFK
ncbi:carbohydrate ABC transporter membrane protein 2, CUT1 family (TC 3.A.1.1.-) [Curtobacterium sp. 314Chir4.1]|uniref:carbohydrate ABC transporter permease n=1 Tax=Curtobacterium sp. 314Chir4.1 TaxID=1279028 RepID=UPI000BC6F37D|nr:carbohydrate ABC transporter permease [Curtobacterium sp. 314Chir4.1]SOC87061.1 carbohydrate ABC transporter membrane protein 2, CUT1 family (TC 3.A.1.1.-) [Curtobacterium sp. 314Chir4.1]